MNNRLDNADLISNVMKLIDDAVIKYHEANKRETTDKIHVTEATGCLRYAYFRRTVELKPEANYYTFMGTAIHDAILKFITDRTEIHVENDVLDGYADAIVEINGRKYVLELKTVKRLPQKPYKSHVEQVNCYMNMLGIDKGIIVYVQRSDGRKAVFVVDRDPDLFTVTLDKARYLRKCLDEGKPPSLKDESFCFMCPFRKQCEKESS